MKSMRTLKSPHFFFWVTLLQLEASSLSAAQQKQIHDHEWIDLIGSKAQENYEVQKGDTLWSISKRIFGNSEYWKKFWTFNHEIINPHVVSPGRILVFHPGSATSVPQFSLTASNGPSHSSSELTQDSNTVSARNEYDKIPSDWWAPVEITDQLKKKYDEYGIDKELRVSPVFRATYTLPALAHETTLPYLGEIKAAKHDGVILSSKDVVFIASNNQDLQVGVEYSLLSEPELIADQKSDRKGYHYGHLGVVKITGIQDNLYVGEITQAFLAIERGTRLYPLLPSVKQVQPTPAQSALEALAISNSSGLRYSAQFHTVHFDRGLEDGVQVGNVFRIYQYDDTVTQKPITQSDWIPKADALVLHATAQFSTAILFSSEQIIEEGDFGVLLTDLSVLKRTKKFITPSGDFSSTATMLEGTKEESPEEIDELDRLDQMSPDGLGHQEQKEIQELNRWDETKDPSTTTEPSLAPEESTSTTTTEPGLESHAEPTLEPEAPSLSEPSTTPESNPTIETAPDAVPPSDFGPMNTDIPEPEEMSPTP